MFIKSQLSLAELLCDKVQAIIHCRRKQVAFRNQGVIK